MRSRSRSVRVIAGGALLAALAAPGNAQATQEAAKRYFQSGVALITGSDPNYQDAYYQFQLAYQESSKSWKVLGNLGLCALKLERDAEALDYYEQYLKKGGNEIAQEERAAIEQDLLLLRGNLAVVHLTSPVADLQVVDRRAGSTAPAQSYKLKDGVLDLQLRAGSHNLTASSGNRHLSWDVVLEPKASVSHVFDFDAPPPAAAAPAAAVEAKPTTGPTTDSPPARSGSNLRIPAYVALGVGAVGLGIGGYFAWQSSDYSEKADAAFACNPGCTIAQRATVRGLEDDSSSATTKAIVGFAVGGAAVVTGVILLAVSGSSSSETATASVTPWVGYREAGVTGRF
jgi:hypothetical protein